VGLVKGSRKLGIPAWKTRRTGESLGLRFSGVDQACGQVAHSALGVQYGLSSLSLPVPVDIGGELLVALVMIVQSALPVVSAAPVDLVLDVTAAAFTLALLVFELSLAVQVGEFPIRRVGCR
jgi:hypothetical protein